MWVTSQEEDICAFYVLPIRKHERDPTVRVVPARAKKVLGAHIDD